MNPNIYVWGIGAMTSYDEVRRLFEKYGKVRAIRLKSGFGFIDFEDYRHAREAIDHLHGKKIFGDYRMVVESTRKARDNERTFVKNSVETDKMR